MEQEVIEVREQTSVLLPWWLILLDGILLVVLGILLLVDPRSTLILLVQFFGFYWFFSGIFQLAGAFMNKSHRVANIIIGLLGLVAGAVIVLHPYASSVLLPGMVVILLGIDGFLMGLAAMYQAFQGAGAGRFFFGLFSMVIGTILILSEPFAIGVTALPFAIGIFALFVGPAVMVTALAIRKVQKAA